MSWVAGPPLTQGTRSRTRDHGTVSADGAVAASRLGAIDGYFRVLADGAMTGGGGDWVASILRVGGGDRVDLALFLGRPDENADWSSPSVLVQVRASPVCVVGGVRRPRIRAWRHVRLLVCLPTGGARSARV